MKNIAPIHGTVPQCLAHFSEMAGLKHTGNNVPRSVWEPRNRLCELLDVNPRTGSDWFTKHIMPSGVNYHKLVCLLELVGYTLVERQAIPQNQRKLASYIALSVFSVEDVAKQMDVKTSTVLAWCGGRAKPLEAKEKDVISLLELHEQRGNECLQSWTSVLQEMEYVSPAGALATAEAGRFTPRVSKPTTVGSAMTMTCVGGQPSRHLSTKEAVEILAHLVLAAVPIADLLLSDACTPEERQTLRDKTTHGRSYGVFILSNLLNRLCSERARDEIKPNGTAK